MTTTSPWSALSDAQLMELISSGRTEPLGELYLRHSAMVKDAMMRFCPEVSIAEAEEMVQDVFLILYRKSRSYEEQTKFKAWLYGIAVRTVSSWRRTYWVRRKILDRHDNKRVGIAARTSSYARDLEVRDTLTQGLDKLSTGQREVLYLHAVEGFTGEEIAKILSIRPKTVWTRLHRARQKMLEELTSDAVEHVFCEGEA